MFDDAVWLAPSDMCAARNVSAGSPLRAKGRRRCPRHDRWRSLWYELYDEQRGTYTTFKAVEVEVATKDLDKAEAD